MDEKTCKVLIGNKTDLEISRKVTTEEAETLSETYEMSALFETSAKTSYNTSEVSSRENNKYIRLINVPIKIRVRY